MKLQVLVSTMYQRDHSLLDRMNIQSDVIVVNQCEADSVEVFAYNGYHVKWISQKARGVGRSRNTALLYAEADILLFADDDVIYEDGYAERVVSFFEGHPSVSVATFNLKSLNEDRPEFLVKNTYRLHRLNCMKFGACRIAIRRKAFSRQNVWFSLLFGGGAKYQAGEDNLFMCDCLRKKLKCVASELSLGTVKQETSTWFQGYSEKYFYDRGALFAAMFGGWARFFLLLMEIKSSKNKHAVSFGNRVKYGMAGINEFRKIK